MDARSIYYFPFSQNTHRACESFVDPTVNAFIVVANRSADLYRTMSNNNRNHSTLWSNSDRVFGWHFFCWSCCFSTHFFALLFCAWFVANSFQRRRLCQTPKRLLYTIRLGSLVAICLFVFLWWMNSFTICILIYWAYLFTVYIPFWKLW